MNLDLLHDVHLHRNRLLRSGAQLLSTPPGDPVLGEFLFAASGAAVGPLHWLLYDGVSGQGSPASTWSILAGLNRNETASGLWTWNPPNRGAGTGDGEKAPFALGSNCAFDSSGRLRNWVQNLNADLVDGRHVLEYVGTSAPSAGFIPVYGGTGQLAVADPVNDYDAINRKTWQAGLSGLVVLSPCRVASTARFAGTRSGNVITASANGALVVDGVTVAVNDRVLLKDQQTGGTAIDNGVFTVTATGSAGAAAVLTRASDADQTGELTVGALVYIEAGTTNRATQWSCQHAAGETGNAIDINVQQQIWTKTFQQSAYTAGRGMVLNGLEFNFSQNADYTVGSLFWANAARTVTPLVPPPSAINQFLTYNQTTTRPEWTSITISAISNWPNPILPGTPRTAYYHARFDTDTAKIVDSYLMDDTTAGITSVVAPLNSIASATVGLGSDTKPWASVWSKVLRLAPVGGTGSIGGLLGTQDIVTDPNANHRQVVGWPAPTIKAWLGITSTDVGAVPTSRQLTIAGTAGQINVSTQATWDLSDNRTWTLSLDLTTLDTHWVTLHTDQALSGTKAWYSVAGDAAEVMVSMGLGSTAEPGLKILAGGALLLGDGVSPAAARIDFASNRLRISGKDLEIASTAVVWLKSAVTGAGTPQTLLGLTTDDRVQKVTAADLTAFIGAPALAVGAVGYGDASNRLTGDASKLKWDATNFRLGINVANPTTSLDMTGAFSQTHQLATGNSLTYPGSRVTINDTSTSSADWTNRILIGAYLSVTKSGLATYATSASLEGQRTEVNVSAGTVSQVFGHRVHLGVGGSGVNGGLVTGVYVSPAGSSSTSGTINTLTQFLASDIVQPYPQPATHYGFRCANLTAGSGAVRTAGLALELTTTGTGERFNIYAPGSAPSYFAGNVGLGVVGPAARLEFGVGTTTLAPARFASTSSASILLTTPLAGALESRGDRLTFTDTTPTRHLIAHLDDMGFTNDASSEQGGGVVLGPNDYVQSAMTAAGYTEALGSDPFTIWVRFLVPKLFRGPTYDCVASLHDGTIGANSGFNNAFGLRIGATGQLHASVSTTGAQQRWAIRNNFTADYGGHIVDLVVVRNGTAQPSLFINGSPVAWNSESTQGGTPPAWDMPVVSNYLNVGNFYSSYGSVSRFHRAAVFNRPLSAADALALSQNGLDDMDRWGTTKPSKTYDFATETLGSNDASNITVTNAQTVNGSPGWVTATRINSTGRIDLNATLSGTGALRKFYAVKHQTWTTGGTPSHFGASVGGNVTDSSLKSAVPAATETTVLSFTGSSAVTAIPTAVRVEPGTSTATTPAVSFPAGTAYSLKALRVFQVGAIVHLDLGIGCGNVIPDLSGRYHGNLVGSNWSHYISTCPAEVTQGPGTVAFGLRRFTQTISAKDGDTVTVTHNLGTMNLTVGVWSATGQWVHTAIQRKVGSETNAIEVGFALVGAPTTPIPFLVVVIG